MRDSTLRWHPLVHGLTAAQKATPDTLSALLIIGFNLDRIEYWQHQDHDVLAQSLRACSLSRGQVIHPMKDYPESEPVLESTTVIGIMTAMTHHVNELAQRQQELHIKLKELCQVLGLPYSEERNE